MNIRNIPFLLICMLLSACSALNDKGFSAAELELINGGEDRVMRVLKADDPADLEVLRLTSAGITDGMMETDAFGLLCRRMLETVRDPENDGVGIAAPQVGISRRLIAVQRFDKEGEPFEFYVNPEIVRYGDITAPGSEGCLSVPSCRGTVERSQEIDVRYRTVHGTDTLETLNGFTAVIFQHEIDHLYGILYVDKAVEVINDAVTSDSKPVIGISMGYSSKNSVGSAYVESVIRNGGVPYLIPVTEDMDVLRQIVSGLDGIIFTGGEDIDPAIYGAENHPNLGKVNHKRDRYDIALFRLAYDKNIPMLGICRGLQLVNVAMGGTLYQDIPSEKPSDIDHRPGKGDEYMAHAVDLLPGSQASGITGAERIMVNSMHHQGIRKLAPGLKVSGWTSDGIPEVVEAYPSRPILAVQFHPELLAAKNETLNRLFEFLVREAEVYRLGKH